ncbi:MULTISPECIES: LPXTG cell wall anchor domain-containing protein [unclassified Streptomyces]|uniref:LPXTG cell wall anchor domain-containing protein n=1 Tax=unclassified Streptomyces TaxID=2593676 RepID=UPI0007F552B1|nr:MULTISPECIES: LPXTG cell wall anchor domain-containing protein [unclassified Streptomyces]MCM1973426.1 LPXTG cell wall anchor domain-containing protein [Streptomyces sp. G1]SBT92114.1 LPXTG-motif cell wall anchor domain-containing protein [Streptomyces sp. DI166]
MPTLTRACAVSAAAAAALFLAPTAHATPHGDNGTVKIHDATTDEELRHNEPHVCAFYLDAFGFDGGQRVGWHIESWAPTAGAKGETVKSGELVLDTDGHGRTEDMTLPDGHYKLFWNFDGEHGSAKHKVFWTDCEDSGDDGDNGSSASPSSPAGGTEPSTEPSTSTEPGPEPSTGSSEDAQPSSAPSPQGDKPGGDLAETGSGAPVGLLSAVAAVLVAAGGFLLYRRRKA